MVDLIQSYVIFLKLLDKLYIDNTLKLTDKIGKIRDLLNEY